MRPRTIRTILRHEQAIHAEGFGLALVAREGAAEIRELADYMRRLPRDPMADPALPPEQTWGLRSYDSEADNPQPGRDVFDVHSRSTALSIGGRPYSEW